MIKKKRLRTVKRKSSQLWIFDLDQEKLKELFSFNG